MKKWVIIASCVVFAVMIISLAGLWNLGVLIKKTINTYGPSLTQAMVHVEGVRVYLFTGEAHLSNFYLGNPEGFKTPHALKAPSIHLDLNEASLVGNTIVIDKIELIRPEINYEKVWGKDNFKQLLKNVRSYDSTPPTANRPSADKEGKKLIIRDLFIRDAEVTLAISAAVGHKISAQLQDMHLTDIGEKEGGLPPSEAFKIVLSELYEGITSPALVRLLNKELKETVIEDAGKKTSSGLKDASDKIKDLFSR